MATLKHLPYLSSAMKVDFDKENINLIRIIELNNLVYNPAC